MHAELRIEISKLGNKYLAITRRGDGQEILSNEFHHDLSGSAEFQPSWLMGREESGLEKEHLPRRESRGKPNYTQAAADGRRLYRYLFGNGKTLREYLGQRQTAEPCHLALSIGREAYALWRLPWEYLFDGKQFPCLNGTFLISRRPADLRTLTPQSGLSPLHVLGVIANPEDQATFDAVAESSILLKSLEPLISQGTADLEILTEPSSSALLAAVREKPYHAIHFIGHGVYELAQNQGFLCLEDDVGRTELLSGAQLPRFLEGWSPRLFLISACPSAQVGVADAFTSVAEGLLQHDIPGVVATAAHLDAPAATAFYSALYAELAGGQTLMESLQKGRLALKEIDDDRSPDRQRFNWGLPALYLRAPDLRLVHSEATASTPDERPASTAAAEQVALKNVIGRKQELQAIRKALHAGDRVFYIWGSEGIGKQHLISELLARWNPKPSAVLRIRCRETTEPLAMLGQIADFWRSAAPDSPSEAAKNLLDLRLDPYERARSAMQQVASKRYVLAFENIDAWFDGDVTVPGSIVDTTVRNVILGLLSVPGHTVFLFTGERRWVDLAGMSAGNHCEVHLPLLPLQPMLRVMHQWSELRQLSAEQKQAAYWHLGGHPRVMQFLAGWLRCGGDLASLLATPPITDRTTQNWIVYLVRGILDRLDPGESEVLRSLAVIQQPFSTTLMSKLTPVTDEHAAILVDKWQHLGLVDSTGPGDQNNWIVQPTVRRIILADLTVDEANALHRQAANYYGAPLIDAARRQVLARNITGWSQERIAWLASDTNGVLGLWLRQPPEGTKTAEVLKRAIAWQYHLACAGAATAATQIVQTIIPELNRQGQRDLARKLAQQATEAPEAAQAIPEPGTMADLTAETDHLAAVRAYERAYDALDPKQYGIQRAHLLMRMADVHQRLGHRQTVVQCLRIACENLHQEREARDEAECLYKLAVAYRDLPDPRQALVYSQAALELYESLTLPHSLAAVEREQGQILRELGYLDQALERFAASLRMCREMDNRPGVVANLTDIGLLFERLGKTEMAIQVIEEALEHYEYLRSPDHSEVLSLLERLYVRQQRLNEAMARYRTARRETEAQL